MKRTPCVGNSGAGSFRIVPDNFDRRFLTWRIYVRMKKACPNCGTRFWGALNSGPAQDRWGGRITKRAAKPNAVRLCTKIVRSANSKNSPLILKMGGEFFFSETNYYAFIHSFPCSFLPMPKVHPEPISDCTRFLSAYILHEEALQHRPFV